MLKQDPLTVALERMREGQFAGAERILREFIAAQPGNADALFQLGQCALAQGDQKEALFNFRQAVWLQPDHTPAHAALAQLDPTLAQGQGPQTIPSPGRDRNDAGIRLSRQGRLAEAEVCFREAAQLDPDLLDASVNIANVLTLQGRHEEARTAYEAVLARSSGNSWVHSNYSNVLRLLEEHEKAIASARTALELDPRSAGAYNNLGSAQAMLERPAEAERSFRQAVALDPNLAEPWSNLGEALRQLNRFREGADCCRRALAINPAFADALRHLGAILITANELEEAERVLREAIRLEPWKPAGRSGLAQVLWRQGRFEEAGIAAREFIEAEPENADGYNDYAVIRAKQNFHEEALALYARALELKPTSPDAHFNRGLVLMVLGRLEEGLQEYEWRRKCKGVGIHGLPGPEWTDGPVDGRTVYLHAEQGLGDTLHFIRYAPLVKALGATVNVVTSKPIIPLLRSCPGIDCIIPLEDLAAEPVSEHLHVSLLSLPLRMGTTRDTLPGGVPYVAAPEDRARHWRKRLEGIEGLKVGLVWKGSPYHPEDRFRSIPLDQLQPLAEVPGVRLIGLQVGAGREQIAALSTSMNIVDIGAELDQTPGSLGDAAGVLANLDLLIGCDTALCHLAGAMGVPVWVMVPFAPDWRWFLERTDTDWYTSMRLFRATAPAQFGSAIERVGKALRERVEGMRP